MNYEGPERRRRVTVGELADRFDAHEEADQDAHERFAAAQEAVLNEVRAMREEMKPIVNVYQGTTFGGRVLLGMLKAITVIGGAVGVIYAAWRWSRGA